MADPITAAMVLKYGVPAVLGTFGSIFGARSQRRSEEDRRREERRQFDATLGQRRNEHQFERDKYNQGRRTTQANLDSVRPLIMAAQNRTQENLGKRMQMPNFQNPVGNNPYGAGNRFNRTPQRPNYGGIPNMEDGRREDDDRLKNVANKFPQ